jgi:hypothetical protein
MSVALNGRFLRVFEVLDSNGCPVFVPETPSNLGQNPPISVENDLKTDSESVYTDIPADDNTRLVLRVTPEAHDWAVLLADHCSLTVSDLIWQSLLRQADASGFYRRVPTRYVSKAFRRRRSTSVS